MGTTVGSGVASAVGAAVGSRVGAAVGAAVTGAAVSGAAVGGRTVAAGVVTGGRLAGAGVGVAMLIVVQPVRIKVRPMTAPIRVTRNLPSGHVACGAWQTTGGDDDTPENEATPPKRGRRTVPADPTTEAAGLLPRHKGIYHAGCTGYPNPTYP